MQQAATAVEAAAYLLEKVGGQLNYTVLIKLLYLSDREKLTEADAPITGATYYSLPNGPVLSEVLDLINEQPLDHGRDIWQSHIERAGAWDVRLVEPMPPAPGVGRKPLPPDDILRAVGRSDAEIAELGLDRAYFNWLDEIIESSKSTGAN